MYPVGFPFWKTLARAGVTLHLTVKVIKDEEAGVFVATSDDLRGLVAEAPTLDELFKEVQNVLDDLMQIELQHPPANRPVADLRVCAA
jgi:predicted RNase H-like HicB family nuclease